jgi:hypothetical protein
MSVFQSFMTGARAGQEDYQRGQRRQIGGLMASGDYSGAARQALEQGEFALGGAAQEMGDARDTRQRRRTAGIMYAVDPAKAQNYAIGQGDYDLADTIGKWTETATEQERSQARDRAGRLVSVGMSVRSLPVDQRYAAALQLAPQFEIDPSQITPELLTDQGLDGLIAQSMEVKDLLDYQMERERSLRPIVTPGGIIMPPGASMGGYGGGGEDVFDKLPPGAVIRPRPNQPASGQPERAQQANVSFSSPQDARQAISQVVPGVRFTSGTRSQEDNRRVGGAVNSYHTRGRAWDLVPPPGMTMGQLADTMRAQGFRVLNEGDHVHVSW